MPNQINIHPEKKQIKDLTRREINMIYSLVRIGNWRDSEIGRVYKLTEEDVRKVFNNYVELLEAAEKNLCVEQQPRQDPPQERIENPRKRRRDARYATTAERQIAYRARLKEKRRASVEHPSPANETDTPIPAVEEASVTFCQDSVTETSPEGADPQYSTCYNSSVEGRDVSESVLLPVTPESCSERDELWGIQK